MHLLANTLSIGSMSGKHVVYGFLRPYIRHTQGKHSLSILHYESMRPPEDVLQAGIDTISVPDKYTELDATNDLGNY